ncbi:hypothetical protein [Luteolibacter sp. Populi]|uniref:hypothetical protein n=1 Tax=Luteolibacter sp. Populi TaxID=3230487 RepID=UPI003465B170
MKLPIETGSFLWAVSLAAVLFSGGAAGEEGPPAVVGAYWKKVTDAVAASKKEPPSSISLEFKPLFWRDAAGFKGHGKAWLAGAEVGWEKRFPLHVFAVLNENGAEIYNPGTSESRLGEAGFPFATSTVNGALFLPIAGGEQILALASARIGLGPESLEILSVAPSEKTLWTDSGRLPGPYPKTTSEAAYYFTDFDNDGRTEILINRRIREYRTSESSYLNQKLVLEFEPGSLHLRNATSDHQAELVDIFRSVKGDPSIPVIYQGGAVDKASDKMGEAIRPEEEKWRKVVFTDTQPPDLGPDTYLPNQPIVSSDTTPKPLRPKKEDSLRQNANPVTENGAREKSPNFLIIGGCLLLFLILVLVVRRVFSKSRPR